MSNGNLLAHFEDFHDWDPHAAWDDLKVAVEHDADFERIALVGDRTWEQWMARLCKPLTKAAVKYFDQEDADAARRWLQETD
ncbi:STAS/SEC14 domain-containing protein [Thiocystis violacea]|uniref:STAS/SEC14 domain-containing protein n=1 Tax=Thiocystis violacea TaxID=13725 RepID=UPI0019054414